MSHPLMMVFCAVKCLLLYCYVSFQSIRSKMSIRAEDRPKAFEAQFLSTSESVAEYGAFDFKPGVVVRT